MKKILVSIFLVLSSGLLAAQNTTVTATVVDSDSTTWANAPWTLQFQVGPYQSNPANYTIAGSPLSSSVTTQSGTANGSGVISLTVYQSTAISPIGSSWNLQVCPNASTPCASINFSTSTSSVDISTIINAAIQAPRFMPRAGSYGYGDEEAVLQLVPGATYWNVTSSTQRCYTGSSWGACGSTSYTLPVATTTILGGVKPDGTTITNVSGAISVTNPYTPPLIVVSPTVATSTVSFIQPWAAPAAGNYNMQLLIWVSTVGTGGTVSGTLQCDSNTGASSAGIVFTQTTGTASVNLICHLASGQQPYIYIPFNSATGSPAITYEEYATLLP